MLFDECRPPGGSLAARSAQGGEESGLARVEPERVAKRGSRRPLVADEELLTAERVEEVR
jgi:hypothetical protein